MIDRHYLAADLGAESGRLMLATLSTERLLLKELHRFANSPVQTSNALTWNLPQLHAELRTGLAKAARLNLPFSSISTDSWGVDYVLVDPDGSLLSPAFHYRDPRCQSGVNAARAKVSQEDIFRHTGIQFMPFNTLYQLMAEQPGRLDQATHLLGIADAFNYLLSGISKAEASFASTSQLYNPATRNWSDELIHALGLPRSLFPEIIPSGTRLGPIQPEVLQETGLTTTEVIATCSHDTGAAVAAVPALRGQWAYLSSGTWSLIGVELNNPVLTEQCRAFNYTNEIGHGNSVRLLKNIVGLWIVQECRRHWAAEGRIYDYPTLARLAAQARPFAALIRPEDPRFLSPGNMPAKIAAFCKETGQTAPTDPGSVIRIVLESLALLYRQSLHQIQHLIGARIERLHIVGGGSNHELLNQFTASALALPVPVAAGPAEATAIGNVLIQAISLGQLSSLTQARHIVSRSTPPKTYLPQQTKAWDIAWKRFDDLNAAA